MTSQAGSPETFVQPTDSQQLFRSPPEPAVLSPAPLSQDDSQSVGDSQPAKISDLVGSDIDVRSFTTASRSGILTTTSEPDCLSGKKDSIIRLILVFGMYIMGLVHDVYKELPPGIDHEGGPSDFPDRESKRHVFVVVLLLEEQTENTKPEEVMDLWVKLLTKEQRQDFMRKLKHVSIKNELADVFKALRNTELRHLIRAWGRFKEAARAAAPSAIWSIGSTRGIAWSLWKTLRVLVMLEKEVCEAHSTARMSGRYVPKILREPTTGPDFTTETPFDQLFTAFAERARCRTDNPASRFFTNADVLNEMIIYVAYLQRMRKDLTPSKDGSKGSAHEGACDSGEARKGVPTKNASLSEGSEDGLDGRGNNHGFHLVDKRTGRRAKNAQGYGFSKTVGPSNRPEPKTRDLEFDWQWIVVIILMVYILLIGFLSHYFAHIQAR